MKQIILFALFLLTIIACQKQFELTNQDTNIRNGSVWNQEAARIQFARILAKSLNQVTIRNFLKDSYSQLDQNDDELLYSKFQNRIVANNMTLKQILEANQDAQLLNAFGNTFFNDIAIEDPLLTILFPDVETFSINSWNTASSIPKVAMKTSREIQFPSGAFNSFAFDANGNASYINGKTDPADVTLAIITSEEYIAIRRSDRNMMDGTSLNEFLVPYLPGDPCEELEQEISKLIDEIEQGEPNQTQYLALRLKSLRQLYYDYCIETPTGGGPSGECDLPCDRDCFVADEQLFSFHLANNDVKDRYDCGWSENRSDIAITFIMRSKSGGFEIKKPIIVPPLKWKYLKDSKVYNFDIPTGRVWNDWDKNKYEDVAYYAWAELGSGNGFKKFEVKVGGSTGEIEFAGIKLKFTLNSGFTFPFSTSDCDETIMLGGDNVFYCDKANIPGREYSTGSVYFNHGHNAPR